MRVSAALLPEGIPSKETGYRDKRVLLNHGVRHSKTGHLSDIGVASRQ
jgi:hypothetical protein